MSWKYLAVILLLGTAAVSSQTPGRWGMTRADPAGE